MGEPDRPARAAVSSARLRAVAAIVFVLSLLPGWLMMATGTNHPEEASPKPGACTEANVAQAAVGFYRALQGGEADAIEHALSDTARFEEGGFMGMVVDGYRIAGPDDVPRTAEESLRR